MLRFFIILISAKQTNKQTNNPGTSFYSPRLICLISSFKFPRSIFVVETPSEFIDYLSPDLTPKPQAFLFNYLVDIHFVFHLNLKPNIMKNKSSFSLAPGNSFL